MTIKAAFASDSDDDFKRVSDENVNIPVNKPRVFTKAEELENFNADDLALMVKDPSDPTKLNLKHSAF